MTKKKTRRSVPRPGSGRKPTGKHARVSINCRVKPETKQRLQDMEGSLGRNIDMVTEYFHNLPF